MGFQASTLSLLMASFGVLAALATGYSLGVRRGRAGSRLAAAGADRTLAHGLAAAVVAVCAHCRRARTETGWRPLADALEERLGLRFSHGICPDCARDHFPELKRDERDGR